MAENSPLAAYSSLQKAAGVFDCLYDEFYTLIGDAPGYCAYLGYTAEEFEALFHGHLVDTIYEEDRQEILKEIKRQLKESNVFMYENRVVTRDGELRWVWISAEVRTDADRRRWFHCTYHDITEEKKARQMLAVSEQRYEIIMSHTQDIVFELDCVSWEIYYSSNFEAKFGYSVPAKGFPDSMFASDIIFEEDKEKLESRFRSLIAGDDEMECEYRLKKEGGNYIWVEVLAAAIREADGSLLKIVGIIKDINDRKREILGFGGNKRRIVSRDWEEKEERVSFLMDCIAGGMMGCYLEDGFPIYFINSRMLGFLGYDNQKEYCNAVEGFVINSVFAEDQKRMQVEIYRQLEEKNEYETNFRMIKKDGSVIWVNEKGRKIAAGDGREAVISLGVDISVQKEYENQLDLYRKASSGGAFIILLGEESTLLYANDIFYHLFEITKEEMEEQEFHVDNLIYPKDLPMVRVILREALHGHSADCQWEMRVITGKGNMKWFLVNGTFENQKEGMVMNGFITDRTEKHLLEQELIHKELVYRTALGETHFKVWEYDVKNHVLILSRRVGEDYRCADRVEGMPKSLLESGLVHPESKKEVLDMYRKLDQGEAYVQADILSRYQQEEDWSWQRVRYTMVYDEQGRPDFAVAVGEDITKQKEAEMQYQQELQLRMAFNDSLIASFRCNLNANIVEYAEGPSIEHFAPGMSYEKLVDFHNQHMDNPEDALRLKKLMGRQALIVAYRQGKTSLSFEYRRKDKNGRLFWVCATTRLVQDVHNGSLYAYGTLQDIHNKKLMEMTMKNRAEHDMLTGAYNKDTAIQMISDLLEKARRQKSSYALLNFRIDHFAQIVHDSGYSAADRILKEVAAQLMMRFTPDKIVGKFYGDEFIVFVYNSPERSMVKLYAQEVQKAVAMPYMFPDTKCPVSLSVGIVFENGAANGFSSLYHKARLALTASKASGQNHPFIYSESLEGLAYLPEKKLFQETDLPDPKQTGSGENLLLKCMYSLSGSIDFKDSLENTLEELGSYYQGDRVYMVEMDWREQKVSGVYEWRKQNVASIRNSGSLLLKPKEAFEELTGQLPSLRYEKDVEHSKELRPRVIRQLKKMGVRSYFLAALGEEKPPIGYIGVDNPRVNTDNRTILSALCYVMANELTKHRLQEKQEFLNSHDELTGVLNRYSFRDYREGLSEEGLISLGVVSLDINGLKKINREHGNSYGDDIIRLFARILTEKYKDCDIYRLAGDEFLIICENISLEAFNLRLENLKERLRGTISACIGSAWSNVDIHLDSLINSADEKRIIAKQSYYNDIQFDSGRRNEKMRKGLLLALEQNRFFICLQPKMDSRTNQVCGAEALIRYQDPRTGLVPPGKFVPYLENAGLIHYIDFFVLEQVCMAFQRWKEQGLDLIPVSLNFSRSTLLEDNLIARMEEVVDRYHMERGYIQIEITESLGEVERETMTRIGSQISRAGYQLALDDFGAKYSNLSFLSMLHFHHLKLDKGLVNDIITNKSSRLIVKNIMNLCRDLQVAVIAEGVESQEQLEILKELECYYIQGYYYDKPVEMSVFEERYQRLDG